MNLSILLQAFEMPGLGLNLKVLIQRFCIRYFHPKATSCTWLTKHSQAFFLSFLLFCILLKYIYIQKSVLTTNVQLHDFFFLQPEHVCIQHSDQETKHHLCSGTLSLSVPDFLLPSPDCAENQAFKKIDCACITLFTWRQTTERAYEET